MGSTTSTAIGKSFAPNENTNFISTAICKKNLNKRSFSRDYFKTKWHRPVTNSIFISHFKELNHKEFIDIDSFIGKGAYGYVYKVQATHKSVGNSKDLQKQLKSKNRSNKFNGNYTRSLNISSTEFYALKVLRKSQIIAENNANQVITEVEILKLCGHHPFVVKLIDLWQSRRSLYMLTEHLPNGELFLRILRFPLDLARLYIAEIALAIDFLHNAGVIYRDAKPENILLTTDYHIKLIDFGLSKWLKLGRKTNTMCGTFEYMAPEILRGEEYGHAVDWWSLGIIASKMFTKKIPDVLIVDYIPNLSSDPLWFIQGDLHCLSYEALDVIKRLLVVDAQKRVCSVLQLQRLALYKDFQLSLKHLKKIKPLDIITREDVPINQNIQEVDFMF